MSSFHKHRQDAFGKADTRLEKLSLEKNKKKVDVLSFY
jgi:hypothetical protein